MAIQIINTGTSANAGNGDSIRTAFTKVNQNFDFLSGVISGTSTNFNSGIRDVVKPMFLHDRHTGITAEYNSLNNQILLRTSPGTDALFGNLKVINTSTFRDVIMTGTVSIGFLQGFDDVNIIKYADDGSLNFRMRNTYGLGSSEINLLDQVGGSFNIVHQNSGASTADYFAGQNYIYDDSGRAINIGRDSNINFYSRNEWDGYANPEVSITNNGLMTINSTLTLSKSHIDLDGNRLNVSSSTVTINGNPIDITIDRLTSGNSTVVLTTSGDLILPGNITLDITPFVPEGQPFVNNGVSFSEDGPFPGAGSIYFDGTGYAEGTITSAFGIINDLNYTIEWFQKPTVFDESLEYALFVTGDPRLRAFNSFESGQSTTYDISDGIISVRGNYTKNFLNTWTHVAVVKSVGTYTVYIDGVQSGFVTNPIALPSPATTSSNLLIGVDVNNGSFVNTFTGYISNMRWESRVLYQGNFNPPTAPLTASADTKLLLVAENSTNYLWDTSGVIPEVLQTIKTNLTDSYLSFNQLGELYIDQEGASNNVRIPGTLIKIDTDQPNYTQLSLHNHNDATNATSDLMIVRNDGDIESATGLLDIGINSSNYVETQPFGIHAPGSAYMFTNDADLVIGTQTPGTKIIFHAGGTTSNDSAGVFDGFAWRFNRNVQVIVPTPGPLNFTVWNTQNNSAAQAMYQAINDAGKFLQMGINSSNPGATYGSIGPGEGFVHLDETTATLHIGSGGDLKFWSEESTGGYENGTTATLVMSRVDRSSTFGGHVLPAADLTYDLGSTNRQWRSLYVGTATIYIGGIPITVNTASNTLVVGTTPGTTPTTATNLATESFVIDYVAENGGGSGLGSITIPAVPGGTYKGLQVSYGVVHSNSSSDELNVNKIVIHKPAPVTVTINQSGGNNDDFRVSGLADSDVVAMFIVYGDANGPKSLSTLQAFAEAAIDNVVLTGGVEGQFNTVDQMKTAFDGNYQTLASAADGLYANFQFYSVNTNFSVNSFTQLQGTGFVFDIVSAAEGMTVIPTTAGTGYAPGNKILVSYTEYGASDGRYNIVVTVSTVDGDGGVLTATAEPELPGYIDRYDTFTGLVGSNRLGNGFYINSLNYNLNTDAIELSGWSNGGGYYVGDRFKILGTDILDSSNNPLASPANDLMVTVDSVYGGGGGVNTYTITGTIPRPENVWPNNSISDGGADQYDTANYINTDLAQEIAYNNGITVTTGTAFGSTATYSFAYEDSIFALFVTGNTANYVETAGNSGADGDSVTEAGSIYAAPTPEQTYTNAVTHLNVVGSPYAGVAVAFTKTNYGDEVDVLIEDDGDGAGVGITRDSNNGIYNPYREGSWDSDVSPGGTLWNTDGWADFSDLTTRTYQPLYAAFGSGGLGNKIVGTECVMYVPDSGRYYALKFTQWTQNGNGGGFAYTRQELNLNSLQEGIRFRDGTVIKSAEGIGRVKLESPGSRRIEEVYGYKQVSFNSTNGPVVWWDAADLPGGSANFRGAIIKYHAYDTNSGTMVGTIHIVDDSGDENVAHTEVFSGGSDGDTIVLWDQTQEGQLKFKRTNGETTTIKIQWTATVFYGSEFWD